MTECQSFGCEEEATTIMRLMPFAPDLDDLIFPYCEMHASQILANPQVFPGARREDVDDLHGS